MLLQQIGNFVIEHFLLNFLTRQSLKESITYLRENKKFDNSGMV